MSRSMRDINSSMGSAAHVYSGKAWSLSYLVDSAQNGNRAATLAAKTMLSPQLPQAHEDVVGFQRQGLGRS